MTTTYTMTTHSGEFVGLVELPEVRTNENVRESLETQRRIVPGTTVTLTSDDTYTFDALLDGTELVHFSLY
jgi:hypothetical protein